MNKPPPPPPGNRRSANAKMWASAIKRALSRRSNRNVEAGLDELADKLVATAAEGDQWAMLEIGNRVDGKPAQEVEHSGGIVNYDVAVLAIMQGVEVALLEQDESSDDNIPPPVTN